MNLQKSIAFLQNFLCWDCQVLLLVELIDYFEVRLALIKAPALLPSNRVTLGVSYI